MQGAKLLLPLLLLAYMGAIAQAQTTGGGGTVHAPASPPTNASFFFPVHSLTLQPSSKVFRQRSPMLDRALFLIGDDAHSRRWLRRQLEQLHRLNAVGFVVEVESKARLDVLRKLAPELELMPAVGDAVAEYFGFSSYPALLLPAEPQP